MSAFSFFLLLSVIRCLFVSAALPLSPTHFVSSLTCPDARVHDVNGNDTVLCVFVHVHVSVCLLNGKAIFMVSTICLKGLEG